MHIPATFLLHFLTALSFTGLASSFVTNIPSQHSSFLGTTQRNYVDSRLHMGADSEVAFNKLDGTGLRVGIIKTRWNTLHVENLVGGIKESLKECNVTEVFETEVPGSFELPLAARLLALSGTVDAIICTGVLIKGETYHFEYICDAVSTGLMNVGLQTTTPVIFGVLTCLNEEQVISRSCGESNHGCDWGKTAVEMALLKKAAFGKGSKRGSMGFGSAVTPVDSSKTEEKRGGFF